ncbi:hypothetical protein AVO41_01270 [Thiomicrospira sp. WB1]|nr:hypothetical protein AVO41_01270 [Thiomicrospira sp. WB1]
MQGEVDVIDETQAGQDIWLATLKAGMTSGEMGLITGSARAAHLVAKTDAHVGFLYRKEAVDLILNQPTIAWRVMQQMANMIHHNNRRLAVLSLPDARERVEAVLLQMASRYANGMTVIENLPSQSIVAHLANTSRETVSRIINQLVKEKVIEKDRRRLIIRRPECLEDLSQ